MLLRGGLVLAKECPACVRILKALEEEEPLDYSPIVVGLVLALIPASVIVLYAVASLSEGFKK
jgi:hypothetical protein